MLTAAPHSLYISVKKVTNLFSYVCFAVAVCRFGEKCDLSFAVCLRAPLVTWPLQNPAGTTTTTPTTTTTTTMNNRRRRHRYRHSPSQACTLTTTATDPSTTRGTAPFLTSTRWISRWT